MIFAGVVGAVVAMHCNDSVTKSATHESKALERQSYLLYLPTQ
ncbi:hypothetical protein [Mycoplasma wenyonii]|nr:hypothetical protein [Mycoplasma wenyonii]